VSQTYWNRGVRSHRKGAKKIWLVYSIEEDGKIHTKRVNALEALFYKTQIKHKRKAYCATCEKEYTGFFKNDKEILKTECPNCDDSDITLMP
jgi:DNA-directed RNA polymerase subunit RPC12/RpoP